MPVLEQNLAVAYFSRSQQAPDSADIAAFNIAFACVFTMSGC